MPVTPIYSLPYQSLSDPPDGAGLGEDLALEVEAELARIDNAVTTYLPRSRIAAGSVSITPVANTPTSEPISFGKTLPGTVRVWTTAESAVPNTVLETSVSGISSTGATVWVYRTSTTVTSVQWIALGL